jgi:hypothetical protein
MCINTLFVWPDKEETQNFILMKELSWLTEIVLELQLVISLQIFVDK